MISKKLIGKRCQRYRQYIRFSQNEVAKDTGYTQTNISAFEVGLNDNAQIFMWYICHGMPIDYLLTGEERYLYGDYEVTD